MGLNETPSANRLHIGIFGKRNSGKSSLINALTGQNIAVVSDVAGTTTDPVYQAMEIHGIGPCMFIDTAGFDDTGELGGLRIQKTVQALQKTDIAIMIFSGNNFIEEEKWLNLLKKNGTPVLVVINKIDLLERPEEILKKIESDYSIKAILISAKNRVGIKDILEELIRNIPEGYELNSITAGLVTKEDVVLLVMPQDIQAPKGRLILPQVQTIRDLLDNQCIVLCVTVSQLDYALSSLKNPPKLIITDSQAFQAVWEKKPTQSLLTSFSVLFAQYKGDIESFMQGASAIDSLTGKSTVLIAEACTHAPLTEDIGRKKIPNLLKKVFGETLTIKIVSGVDFPEDLSGYDLIIHCGACMFNRRYVLNRIDRAKEQGVPITNYGVVLAKLTGILDKIVY